MPTSESDRILAAGAPVTLADGRVLHLRYTFRALKVIEDRYGSLDGTVKAMGMDDQGRVHGRYFTTIIDMLYAGLLHTGISEDELYELADPARVEEYDEAVNVALAQALARPGGKEGPTTGSPNGSPGQTSTTPPPSDMAEQTSSSGT